MIKVSHRAGVAQVSVVAVTVALAFAASLASAPVMADGHSPWSPVEGALEALEEGRFEDIAGFFCEEQQPAIAALDFDSALASDMPAEPPVEGLSGALGWTAELSSATPTDSSFPPPPENTLIVSGFVTRTLDPELVFELFEEFLVDGSDAGSEIDAITATLDASRVDFSEELAVIQSEADGSSRYLICSEFAALATVAGSADDGTDPTDGGE